MNISIFEETATRNEYPAAQQLGLEEEIPLDHGDRDLPYKTIDSDDAGWDDKVEALMEHYERTENDDKDADTFEAFRKAKEAESTKDRDFRIQQRINSAHLSRHAPKEDYYAIERAYRRREAQIDGQAIPAYHGRKYNDPFRGLCQDNAADWFDAGMPGEHRPEYPMNVNLSDMEAKGIRLHALKLMHLIFAMAYHATAQEIAIPKKVIKGYLNTTMKLIRPIIQDDLIRKRVTLAATGIKRGTQPIPGVQIVYGYHEDHRNVFFTLSDTVFNQLTFDCQVGGNFYAWTDLVNVRNMKCVHALGLLPFFNKNTRSWVDAFTLDKQAAAVLMKVSTLDEKIYNSHINQFLKRAFKSMDACDYFSFETDIDGRSKKTEDVRIAIDPLRAYGIYRRVRKQSLRQADFETPSSPYHVPGRRFRNILISCGRDDVMEDYDTLMALRHTLLIFINREKIRSPEEFRNKLEVFVSRTIENRGPLPYSEVELQVAQTYFERMRSGANDEVVQKLLDRRISKENKKTNKFL